MCRSAAFQMKDSTCQLGTTGSDGGFHASGAVPFFLPPTTTTTCPRPQTSADAPMPTHQSPADMDLIGRLPTSVLTEFRDYKFTQSYIKANAHLFIDTAWIDIPVLRSFLTARNLDFDRDVIMIPSSSSPPLITTARVKRESDALNASPIDLTVKSEPVVSAPLAFRTRILVEGKKEVIELLSDSGEALSAADTGKTGRHKPSSSRGPDQFEPKKGGLMPSDTVWLDPHITSMRIEYLSEIPTNWPVPRPDVPTAFVVDLSAKKFELYDDDGKLIPVDCLVRRQDNDSWRGNSGTGNGTVDVIFTPGEPPIHRRHSRNDCNGCHACSAIDPALLNVTRYELEVESRDAIFAAQQETRRNKGDTAEQRATVAKRSDGTPCSGRPFLKEEAEGKSRGHQYWVACTGWTPAFKESHRTHSIPDNVNEELIVKLFNNKPLAHDKSADTPPCSRIVHPHIGGKVKFCHHPHILNGHGVSQCPIEHRKCPSKRTFYIPVDPSIRKVLIFTQKNIPHNHISHSNESKYLAGADLYGVVGATVAKVDNGIGLFVVLVSPADTCPAASSTKLLFNGQMLGQSTPALMDKRRKRDLIGKVKQKTYPAGLGIAGAYQLYREDREKPIEDRYIHRYLDMPDGGLIIFTCFTGLLALLDDSGVKAFEDDTTFKRIEGDINEWEVVTVYSALERAVTLARAYINRSDTKFFEKLFDIFREVKMEATGRDIGFARFMPNGNLLVMNADMEAAQALGAARSFLKTNISSFSGITTLDPQVFATFFIKFAAPMPRGSDFCPLQDFKSLISAADFKRLRDFMYIDSVEGLHSFSQFINNLSMVYGPDWWTHKEMNDWVIPCLVKSQSNTWGRECTKFEKWIFTGSPFEL
ncbi:hypothetical protein C8J57DRAFT_1257203 [Mycena rebaudengoi]|nr:hypothetical protein C8J57DRAFT_1257203 [Mycena rebaudengoi]